MQSLASTVAEVYEYGSANRWLKLGAGLLSLMKDYDRRSYFIRLFDMVTWQCLFEQELYNEFQYSQDRTFFHSFSGDNSVCGFNFTDEDEAAQFGEAVQGKVEQRQSKRDGKTRAD